MKPDFSTMTKAELRAYVINHPDNKAACYTFVDRFTAEASPEIFDIPNSDVAKRAYQIYEDGIRQKVETEENIGKMVIINFETGDYEVDETGLHAAKNLQAKSPYARLFGIRIGYNVAASLGGVMERVSSDFRYCD
jgi:hypothetical protein